MAFRSRIFPSNSFLESKLCNFSGLANFNNSMWIFWQGKRFDHCRKMSHLQKWQNFRHQSQICQSIFTTSANNNNSALILLVLSTNGIFFHQFYTSLPINQTMNQSTGLHTVFLPHHFVTSNRNFSGSNFAFLSTDQFLNTKLNWCVALSFAINKNWPPKFQKRIFLFINLQHSPYQFYAT